MHIVTVIHDFRGGGAERVSVLLANAFARVGHRSEIVCLSQEGPYRDSVRADVAVRSLDRSRMFAAVPDIARLMRQAPGARFLSHLTHVNVVTLAAARLARGARVWCVEHNDFARAAADTPSRLVRLAYGIAPWLYRSAEAVFCVADSVRDSIPGARSDAARFPVVANPVDPVAILQGVGEDPGHPWLQGAGATLVACGRLTAQKNYPMMLEALARLRGHRDVRLIVLGQGPLADDLSRAAASLGLAGAVDFRGFCANPYAFFARARLFVSTSDYEGLPMTVIEALYCGADVVSTESCSGLPALTAGAGFGACVPRGDIGAFVAAVEDGLARAPVAAAAKRTALRDYEIDRVAAAYLERMAV